MNIAILTWVLILTVHTGDMFNRDHGSAEYYTKQECMAEAKKVNKLLSKYIHAKCERKCKGTNKACKDACNVDNLKIKK